MKRRTVTITALFLLSAFPLLFIESPVYARVTAIAAEIFGSILVLPFDPYA